MLAREFCAGISLADYRASVLPRSAVERQLEILGEAARRSLDIAPELKTRLPGLIEALDDSELSAYPLLPDNG